MSAPPPLAGFLRARRSQVRPDEVGVTSTGRRRVAGLRREEVASLAGISVDYYVRLEQGRERHPSAAVLHALAGALRLDDDGRLHLFRAAGLAPRSPATGTDEPVDPRLQQLLQSWPDHPALIFDRAHDVLAANRLAEALLEGLTETRNLLELVFLVPATRELYADWDAIAADSVAGFRLAHQADPEHRRTTEVMHALLQRSADFRRLWQRHEARGKRLQSKTLLHPAVGELTLQVHTFDVRAVPGQQLVVYHAAPGSTDSDALQLLGALAATADRFPRTPGHGTGGQV
ncbi:helix-turn-helix domain-containing protein [Kineococcus arenarius]|uniref:helix-turn-helix domain-containing protein n=1 Tax=Kineococcus sp. SYSU DK007 TaxID=3383128 RepID=UPI003D7DBB61